MMKLNHLKKQKKIFFFLERGITRVKTMSNLRFKLPPIADSSPSTSYNNWGGNVLHDKSLSSQPSSP
jgi:hypothetical protein